MHFLLLKSAHVAVAVCHGCLLVLLACSAWFKGLYINTCFLFLVGLFICFSHFFWTILVVLIFALFCCGRFSRLKFPVPHSFSPFSPASFLLLAWWHYPWVLCCLLCFFVFFSYLSPLFLRCFPSLRFLGTFAVSDYFGCFTCFSCFSLCACIVRHICMHEWYLGTPHTHHIPLYDLWQSYAHLDLVVNQFAPPHTCQNYVLRDYLCLCLACFAFAGC